MKLHPLICFSYCVCINFSVAEWEGETLELTRISRLDMGAYLCIASNGVPPTVSKRIKVSVDCEYHSWKFQLSIAAPPNVSSCLHPAFFLVYILTPSPPRQHLIFLFPRHQHLLSFYHERTLRTTIDRS